MALVLQHSPLESWSILTSIRQKIQLYIKIIKSKLNLLYNCLYHFISIFFASPLSVFNTRVLHPSGSKMYLKIKSQSLCNHFDRPDTSDDSSGLDRGRSQEVCKTQQRAKKRMNFGTLEDWKIGSWKTLGI